MPTNTVGAGKTYSTLQAWANARANSGVSETAQCFAGSDLGALSAISTFVEMHITVAPGNRHNGTDAGHTGVAYSTGFLDIEDCLIVEVDHLRLENVLFLFRSDSPSVNYTISNNMTVSSQTSGVGGGLIAISGQEADGPPNIVVNIFNNIVIDFSGSPGCVGIGLSIATSLGDGTITGVIYNNSIQSSSYCLEGDSANGEIIAIEVTNNLMVTNGPNSMNSTAWCTAASDYNFAVNPPIPGAHSNPAVNPSSIFQSGTNFNIKTTCVAKDAAKTLTAPYATDAVGTSRPQGSAWDAGALELVTAVVTSRLRRAFPFRFFRH